MTGWRTMEEGDLPAVQALADAAHPGLAERPEVLRDKRAHYPPGCLVLASGGAIAGYGFAHPWDLDAIPRLDAPLGGLPVRPTCLYLHDVVVAPEARGHGAAGAYVARLVEQARELGVPVLALVSVYETWPMWQRHGFRIADRPALADVLKGYGPSARYMVRAITGPKAA